MRKYLGIIITSIVFVTLLTVANSGFSQLGITADRGTATSVKVTSDTVATIISPRANRIGFPIIENLSTSGNYVYMVAGYEAPATTTTIYTTGQKINGGTSWPASQCFGNYVGGLYGFSAAGSTCTVRVIEFHR